MCVHECMHTRMYPGLFQVAPNMHTNSLLCCDCPFREPALHSLSANKSSPALNAPLKSSGCCPESLVP